MNYDHTCPYCGYPTFTGKRCAYCADNVLDALNLQRFHTDAAVMSAETVATDAIYDVVKIEYLGGKIRERVGTKTLTAVMYGRTSMSPVVAVGIDAWKHKNTLTLLKIASGGRI